MDEDDLSSEQLRASLAAMLGQPLDALPVTVAMVDEVAATTTTAEAIAQVVIAVARLEARVAALEATA